MAVAKSVHIPVLLQEVSTYLALKEGETVFDGTLGGGGYTRALAETLGSDGRIIACDQDQEALARFRAAGVYPQVELHHANFRSLDSFFEEESLDAAVLDLGISSDQLEERKRGISFQDESAPLDMRMNASGDNHLTAWGILNTWEEEEIATMLYIYGDERNSRKIAAQIVEQRKGGDMETVGDLLRAVQAVSPKRGKIHPATRTFQALRIVVNDELGSLEEFLSKIPQYIKTGGRLVIVSFHSAEDRIVKHIFKQWKSEEKVELLTKKPVVPTEEEIAQNPRARSAKLRACKFN